MALRIAGAVLLLLGVALPVMADDCRHAKDLEQRLDALSARMLQVEAESGSLRIEGRQGQNEVVARGRACASDEGLLDDIELKADDRGGELRIEARTPSSGWSLIGRRYARLDLVIEVPAGLALEVQDGSGSVEVRDVASLELTDGSGSIDVRGVTGDVELTDGSGSIEIEDVGGRVLIVNDGSGSIDIVRVQGDVEIGNDGSGSIEIREVVGGVEIGNDGSGSIKVADVRGGLHVGNDGSGSLDYTRVDGAISVPRD